VKATEILMQEHRLIEQVLDCLEEAACRLDDGEEIEAEFFIDAAEFVAGFADGSHHRKEEDILFVAMTAKDMPADSGPVAVMLHEHEEGRRLTAAFRSAAEQMKTGDAGAAMDVVQNVLDYVNLLREHITKSRKFEQALAEDEASGEIKRYQELALKLSAALSVVT